VPIGTAGRPGYSSHRHSELRREPSIAVGGDDKERPRALHWRGWSGVPDGVVPSLPRYWFTAEKTVQHSCLLLQTLGAFTRRPMLEAKCSIWILRWATGT
jgi:hypothetical protein